MRIPTQGIWFRYCPDAGNFYWIRLLLLLGGPYFLHFNNFDAASILFKKFAFFLHNFLFIIVGCWSFGDLIVYFLFLEVEALAF